MAPVESYRFFVVIKAKSQRIAGGYNSRPGVAGLLVIVLLQNRLRQDICIDHKGLFKHV